MRIIDAPNRNLDFKRDTIDLGGALEPAVFLQLLYNAVAYQVLSFKRADFLISGSQQEKNVSDPLDARIEFFFIESNHALITFFGILDTRQPHSFGEDLYDIAFILRVTNESHRINKSSEHTFHCRGR